MFIIKKGGFTLSRSVGKVSDMTKDGSMLEIQGVEGGDYIVVHMNRIFSSYFFLLWSFRFLERLNFFFTMSI